MYKGCTNELCSANQTKLKYKKDEEYCNLCGEKLKHVCAFKSCYKFIESEEKYCLCCSAQKEELRDNRIDKGKKIMGVLTAAAMVTARVISKLPKKKR